MRAASFFCVRRLYSQIACGKKNRKVNLRAFVVGELNSRTTPPGIGVLPRGCLLINEPLLLVLSFLKDKARTGLKPPIR